MNESDTYVIRDDSHQCVICDDTRSLGVQDGGKGGFIANGDRYIHSTCLNNNIELLICKGKLIEIISFDPLSDGWYFYNWNDEYGRYDHVDPELTYCPLCSDPLSDHKTILEIDKLKFEDEDKQITTSSSDYVSFDSSRVTIGGVFSNG